MTFKRGVRGIALKGLYPLFLFLGALLKGRKEALQRAIIHLNNALVRIEAPQTKKIMILLPHCLQTTECTIRLTHNIYNCARCGRCGITDLIGLAEDNKLDLFVATGGTLARKIVSEVRPGAIVAVACERDLSSGLGDTFPIPVLGIWNERPFGPCHNTRVDIAKVREAIEFFSRD